MAIENTPYSKNGFCKQCLDYYNFYLIFVMLILSAGIEISWPSSLIYFMTQNK